ncbi:class I SAM-dependent methyltransferase [Streptomyces sp. NPDC020800]|uniref:class I SAM-dependent methyltransferase n=1 Tax=Streptomyces sp. NPDC020800 TaxID=3365092 RepID=UPI00379DA5FB
MKLLLPQGACSILDIACGTGIVTRRLSSPERVVVGVDRSPGMLSLAGRRVPGGVVRGDATRLPFASDGGRARASVYGPAPDPYGPAPDPYGPAPDPRGPGATSCPVPGPARRTPVARGVRSGTGARQGRVPFRDRGRDAHEHLRTPPVRAVATRWAAARERPAAAVHTAVATAA